MLSSPTYRHFLKQRFEMRGRLNPRYSLRAFARDLEMAPSKISEILSGKRGLSAEKAEFISRRLNLSPEEEQVFVTSVKAQHARSVAERAQARKKLKALTASPRAASLTLEAFRIVADWQHNAILELCALSNFRFTPESVARRLDIPLSEARASIERLLKLELLEKNKKGKYRACDDHTIYPGGVPSEAVRNHHAQMLRKAEESIQKQSIHDRHLRSLVFAFQKERYTEAVEEILEFYRNFKKKFANGHGTDRVYCLSTQFFALDREESSEELAEEI